MTTRTPEQRSAAMKGYYEQNPEARLYQAETMRKYHHDHPGAVAKQSESQKKRFADPLFKEQQLARMVEARRAKGSQKGTRSPTWKGGHRITNGYVELMRPGHPNATHKGYVREHRLVMEAHLGRHLTPEEVVHHIDGDKANNAVENLQLVESKAAHIRLHHEIERLTMNSTMAPVEGTSGGEDV